MRHFICNNRILSSYSNNTLLCLHVEKPPFSSVWRSTCVTFWKLCKHLNSVIYPRYFFFIINPIIGYHRRVAEQQSSWPVPSICIWFESRRVIHSSVVSHRQVDPTESIVIHATSALYSLIIYFVSLFFLSPVIRSRGYWVFVSF